MTVLLVLLAAYLIGGIPFGYLIVRLTTGEDVRDMGSGNIGATNVLRTTGRAVAILTLLLDIGKGALAVWLADRFLNGSLLWMSVAALVVMLGHAFPIYLRFRGGKAVASFIGAFLYLTPLAIIATLLVFVIVVASTKLISMGSIVSAGLFPVAVFLIYHPNVEVLAASVIAGVFIIWRHKSNIGRIRSGTENVFSFRGVKR